jgi:sugar (pentulose or hexulose) kinase
MSLVAGLDVGTHSIKLAAYDLAAYRVVVTYDQSPEPYARNTRQKPGTDGRLVGYTAMSSSINGMPQ